MGTNPNAIHPGYVVERYVANVGGGDLDAICGPGLASTRAKAGAAAGAVYLRSIVVPGDEMVFDIFSAVERGDVETALRRAGIGWDRVNDAWLVNDRAPGCCDCHQPKE